MTQSAHSIDQDFVVMSPDKNATIERFDPTLYARLDEKYGDFTGHDLIACHTFTTDWPTWEMHPKGDEVVLLLSGRATFVLQLESGEQRIVLEKSGEYAIVPKGIWHTAKTSVETRMLFVTPGEGTENREI